MHNFTIIFSTVIASVFSALVLIHTFHIGSLVKKMLGRHPSEIIKPFDCLPCMSFWCAIILVPVLIYGVPLYIVSIMAAYVAAYIINKL